MDDRAVIYLSDQTHSSVARAARALGFRPDQVRVIPSDQQARIRLDALRAAIAADRAGRAAPAGGGRQRRHDRGRRESTRSASCPRSVGEVASGCTSTAPTAPSPASASAGVTRCAGIELADSITLDPAQVAVPADRAGRAARARRRRAAPRLRDRPRLPQGRRGGRSRGELLRSRAAAHAHLPCAQALDVTALLRRRRLSQGDRPAASTWPLHARAADRAVGRAGADVACVARRGHVPAAPAGRRRRSRPGAHQCEPGRARSSAAARCSSPPGGCADATCCGCASSTTRLAGRGRPRARVGRVARGRLRTRRLGARAGELPAARGRAGSAARRSMQTACVRSPLFASLDDDAVPSASCWPHASTAPCRARPSWSSGRSAATSSSS